MTPSTTMRNVEHNISFFQGELTRAGCLTEARRLEGLELTSVDMTRIAYEVVSSIQLRPGSEVAKVREDVLQQLQRALRLPACA